MDPYVLRLLASLSAGFDRASHAEIPQVFNIGSIESFSRIHAKQIHSCKIGVEVVALISLARAKLVVRYTCRRHEKPMPQYATIRHSACYGTCFTCQS